MRSSQPAPEPRFHTRTVTSEEHWKHVEKTWRALETDTYLGKPRTSTRGGTREAMPFRTTCATAPGGHGRPLCLPRVHR